MCMLEMQLVQGCGDSKSGAAVHASGWTEVLLAALVRGYGGVR